MFCVPEHRDLLSEPVSPDVGEGPQTEDPVYPVPREGWQRWSVPPMRVFTSESEEVRGSVFGPTKFFTTLHTLWSLFTLLPVLGGGVDL